MSRPKPLVALLLLTLWCRSEMSWALALVALAHGPHHVSLGSSNSDSDIVLHHHPISSGPMATSPKRMVTPSMTT